MQVLIRLRELVYLQERLIDLKIEDIPWRLANFVMCPYEMYVLLLSL